MSSSTCRSPCVTISSPARSWSPITTAIASWNFSRKCTSSMQVSRGRPHMLTSNQRGRGKDPVVVLGRIRSAEEGNVLLFWFLFEHLEKAVDNPVPPTDEKSHPALLAAVKGK